MKKILIILSLVVLSLPTVVSCGPATAVATNNVTTLITSNPSGAAVIFEGKTIGTTPCTVSMPITVTVVNHGSTFKPSITTTVKPWKFEFMKDGVVENVSVDPNAVPLRNGMAVYEYQFQQAAYINDPTIVEGEAYNMVRRDNPGQTALERTIIRWFFDSDPRGCRVFWRVVSNIPQIVKNTNEQYLGTTPFEETRSFNILGLTYENSTNVQVEIKITKDGYMDQVKRFNVRQAIDQQEISSFFDLVENE